MPDVFTNKKRSEVMSRIRSRGNKDTELRLVSLLRQHRISGWRRHIMIHAEPLKVRPDFVFRHERVALFVDGCFWHGCPKHGTKPRGNASFWKKKFEANKTRDRLVTRTLRRSGWRVLRLWEHELSRKNEARAVRRILQSLSKTTGR